jgi:hypothetical protein
MPTIRKVHSTTNEADVYRINRKLRECRSALEAKLRHQQSEKTKATVTMPPAQPLRFISGLYELSNSALGRSMQETLRATPAFENSKAGMWMRTVQEMSNSPLAKTVRQIENLPSAVAMRAVSNSPTMVAIRAFHNSPEMEAMRPMYDSPAMKAMRAMHGSFALTKPEV